MATLLAQILGGLFGFTIAYIMYRFAERKYERSTAEARARYLVEMEELKQAKLKALKRQGKTA